MTEVKTAAEYEQRITELEQEVKSLRAGAGNPEQKSDHRTEIDVGRLNHLLELLPAGVVIIDGSGIVAEANPAARQFLGEPLKGQPWFEIINRSFAPRSDDGHEVSLRDGRRISLMTRALDVEPGQLLLLTDQTETRLLQGRVSHYQRLSEMGRMMASLAHQVRTPLSAAMLYVDHLMRPDLQPEQRQKFAGKAKSRLTNLEQQVRDMLIFARGEMRLEDQLSSAQLMADLEDMLDLPLVNHNADCDCQNLAPDSLIQCNKEALLGVCMNLVENALQACGKGCDIAVTFSRESEYLRIAVIDQGPGMDQETLQQALQPFYTTKSHGTGLGLAVAQVVSHAHHGRFELDSTLGEGTKASLLLPCIQSAEG